MLALMAVLIPIEKHAIAIFVLVLFDLILGLIAAIKRGEKITSNGLKTTVIKLFVFETALALGFIAEKYLLNDLLPISKIISTLVGIVELTSVFENLDEIYGQPLFKVLIDKLGSNRPK